MKGFDPKFTDLPDYILGITKEIWEDRNIETLRHYYAPKIAVRSPAGVVVGNETVIAATMSTLAEFPDRQLLGEDVIYSGDEEAGFLSSHRLLCVTTHTGDGAYGPASGKKLSYRVMADCAAKDNQIMDEWMVRDQGAIVSQLGIDPKTYAAQQIELEGGPETAGRPFSPATDVAAVYDGTGNQAEPGVRYAALLGDLMDGAMGTIFRAYDRAVHMELPSGRAGHGWAAADSFWIGLRSAFPSAEFRIDHQIGRNDPDMPPRAALRWSLSGRHEGWGAFGAPTGAEVYILGISHAEFGPQGLRREWILVDETAIWKQILLHTG